MPSQLIVETFRISDKIVHNYLNIIKIYEKSIQLKTSMLLEKRS